jgi:hypothetical protein
MSHLCNRCVRELLILTRTWFAFGLPSKPGVTSSHWTMCTCAVHACRSYFYSRSDTYGTSWEFSLHVRKFWITFLFPLHARKSWMAP